MRDIILELIQRYPPLKSCEQDIETVRDAIIKAFETDNFLYICGNGGSAADSEHIAGELMKSYLIPRPLAPEVQEKFKNEFPDSGAYLADKLEKGLRVVALTGHYALSTAVANDTAADVVFAQQIVALGRPGDILLAISTSGNSANVCHAVRTARLMGLKTVGLSGESGGTLFELCDLTIRVPESETFKIQEYHLPVYHSICAGVERHFFGD